VKKIVLKKHDDKRIRHGHKWIFSNEIFLLDSGIENGEIVEVYSNLKEFLGCGFFNKNSLIAVRIISTYRVDDFYLFAAEKILQALKLRTEIYPGRNSFRLVFSESDFLPGLIIDKYNNTYVLQVNSYGMEKNISSIVKVLKEELHAENIFSKNEINFRQLEGLPNSDEIYLGELSKEVINDGKVIYEIDFRNSHKTGFYYDQSDNRFFIQKFVKGKSVLDAFCNSGGFGLHAAVSGAVEVDFIDSSSHEIENAKINFELNKCECKSEFVVSDVFDYLRDCISKNKKYDVVMIDPPAFAKNKKSLVTACKGYEKLNMLALQCTNNNGYLVTSSCSYHLKKAEFFGLITSAAIKAEKQLQLLYYNQASMDHPTLPGMEETSYLKFAVFRVFEMLSQ
jgi:23S rRNA (cytosine1962-C5)-methyltransferase